MKLIDLFLDRVTMYRLALYYLLSVLGAAMLLGALGYGLYNPIAITLSAVYLTLVCWATNRVFAYILHVPVNPESSLITALILALIITPPPSAQGYVFLTAAAGLAIASKYLFTIRNHNIFNPAAIAVTLTALGAGESASWWVGNTLLLPVVVAGGIMLVRKVQRGQMVVIFLATSAVALGILTIINGGNPAEAIQKMVLTSPIFFFAFVMLTEPLTSPTTLVKQRYYAALAGMLFPPQVHILSLYSTPELALVLGNIGSYLLERKTRLLLTLRKKVVIGANLADFVLTPANKLTYRPGQYIEVTLPHTKPDERGSRRYFTLASSPTENEVRIGVKFHPRGSTYKHALLKIEAGTSLAAGQPGGDFVLPNDKNEKLVFIAGGIGITPYRSMVKYLLDTRDARNITLLYGVSNRNELIYADVFAAAQQQFGAKVTYVLGRITTKLIRAAVPDLSAHTFYISGPHAMVMSIRAALVGLGVASKHIKTDFFPGYT